MNSFEWNKILGALLLALLIAWISGFIAHKVTEKEPLEKNVYVVEGVTQSPVATPTVQADKPLPEIGPLLASANLEAGQKTARVCTTCHSFGKGEPGKLGPNLYGIVGNKHAHAPDYNYSDAMKGESAKEWTYEALNQFLSNPKGTVKGTKMSFAGLKNDQDRANVIAYLRTLADKPQPLP